MSYESDNERAERLVWQRYVKQYGDDITLWDESTLGDYIAELTRINPAEMAAAQARVAALSDEELDAIARAKGWT